MLLIARFYQKFSGIKTYYWLYILAIVLLGMMFVRDGSAGMVVGDLFTDLLAILGGGLLLFLSLLLYLHMMRQKNHE